MNAFDLLFIALFLGSVVTLLAAAVVAIGGARKRAGRLLQWLAVVLACYVATVCVVSLASPREWGAIGVEQRYDDWAVTIMRADRTAGRYRLAIRVANRGRGRAQRAPDAKVQLVATDGRRFDAAPAPAAQSLGSLVQAGAEFETTRDYDIPDTIAIAGADVVHGGGPGLFIIGDNGSLFHTRKLVRLQ